MVVTVIGTVLYYVHSYMVLTAIRISVGILYFLRDLFVRGWSYKIITLSILRKKNALVQKKREVKKKKKKTAVNMSNLYESIRV